MSERFNLEFNTMWSFKQRGSWETHKGDYPGNWSPFVPKNIILRYSKENDLILDQFIGSGTTLVEAKLLNRKGIGCDINPKAIGFFMEGLLDEYYVCPRCTSPEYFPWLEKLVESKKIDFAFVQPEREIVEWGKYFEEKQKYIISLYLIQTNSSEKTYLLFSAIDFLF